MSLPCSSGMNLYLNFIGPEALIAERLSSFAHRYPCIAFSLAVISSFVIGIIKVVSVPVLSLLGIGVFTVKAIISACTNKPVRPNLEALLLCLLTVICIAGFLLLAIFTISPSVTFCLITVGISANFITTFARLSYKALGNKEI